MNVTELRKVAKFIQEEVRRFSMFEGVIPAKILIEERADLIVENFPPPCGTVLCIAGAAYVRRHPVIGKVKSQIPWSSVREGAVAILGLSDRQANCLFYLENWPPKFAIAYNAAMTPRQRVKVAVARIEHFIKTNGEE